TFNCITVDGDTSTNDMVLVMANGQANNNSLTKNHPEWSKFINLLKQTSEEVAKMIAQDGEGASKLIEVNVEGATNQTDAVKVGKSFVRSSLVNTAIFSTEPNCRNLIVAIGNSGVDIDPDVIYLSLGDINILKNSEPVNSSEKFAIKYLENDNIYININL